MSLIIKKIVKISFIAIDSLRLLYVFKTGPISHVYYKQLFKKKSNQNNKNLI